MVAYFDFNGDMNAVNTGWIAPDDVLLNVMVAWQRMVLMHWRMKI